MIQNFCIGVFSGILSGLLVAFHLWLWGYFRRAPLELFYVAENRAVLKNNRLRPVVVGGAWEFGNGSVFFRPDGFRGGEGGFYIPRLGEFVVGTSYFGAGQTAEVAYKYVRTQKNLGKRIQLEERNVVDASEVAVYPEKYPQWSLLTVTMKGFA